MVEKDGERAPASGAPDDGEPTQVGPYRLTRRLGAGGMGTVYLGVNASGGQVAVKLIRPDLARLAEFRTRLKHEADSARRVARFCTAAVLDVNITADPPYLVTEFVDGPTLAEAVSDRGPLTPAELHQLAVSMTTALMAIHRAGIVHRDLKPSNILLSRLGPKVIDFGIARALDTASMLSADRQIGTPAFMAPEQARGESVTSKADVFAWGGALIYAGTGRYPFGTGSAASLLYRVVTDEPALDGFETSLRPLVEDAMRKDAAERPSAEELYARLLDLRVDSPVAGPDLPLAEVTALIRPLNTTPPISPPPRTRDPDRAGPITPVTGVVPIGPPPRLRPPSTEPPPSLSRSGRPVAPSTPSARDSSAPAREAAPPAAQPPAQPVAPPAARPAPPARPAPAPRPAPRPATPPRGRDANRPAGQRTDRSPDQPSGRAGDRPAERLSGWPAEPSAGSPSGRSTDRPAGRPPGRSSRVSDYSGALATVGPARDGLARDGLARDGSEAPARRRGPADSPPPASPGPASRPASRSEPSHAAGRSRVIVPVAVVAVVVVIAAAVFALSQRGGGGRPSAANVPDLVAQQAIGLQSSDAGLARRLALAAYRADPSSPRTRNAVLALFGTGIVPTTVDVNDGAVLSIAVSPDGQRLATGSKGGSKGGSITLWDLADRAHPHPLSTVHDPGWVYSLAFNRAGSVLATGDDRGSVRLWSLGDGNRLVRVSTTTAHTDAVRSLAFTPDGNTLASGGADGRIVLWDVTNPAKPGKRAGREGLAGEVGSVAFNRTGALLAFGGHDGTVRLWNVQNAAQPEPVPGGILRGHTRAVQAVAFTPDGTVLVSGGVDATVRLWDVRDPSHPSERADIPGHVGGITGVAINGDASIVATASDDQTVGLSDIVDPVAPTALAPLTGHTQPVSAVAFVPNAAVVVAAGYDATVRIWDVDPDRLAGDACAAPSNRITVKEWTDNFDGLRYVAPCG